MIDATALMQLGSILGGCYLLSTGHWIWAAILLFLAIPAIKVYN